MQEQPKTEFIPALDGLRGIAILLVLFHHLTLYRPDQGVDQWIASIPLFGWTGVNLFFVLSGFLITGILMDTRGSRNYFSVFYARRALRIFPLYYLVLAIALILLPRAEELHTVIVGPYPTPPTLPYWLYLTNFSIADRSMVHGWLDVAWSLAIEEQFYLVWALVVWYCPPRWLGALCASIFLLEPIGRIVALARDTNPEHVYVLTYFRLDGLATGSFLAWLQRFHGLPASRAGLAATLAVAAAGVVSIVIDAGDSWWWHPRMQQVGFSLIALGGAVLLIGAVNLPKDAAWPRLLSAGWLRAFGKYSYCLYLVHLPVMRLVREYVFDPREFNHLVPSPWVTQIIFYILAIAPAYLIARISWAVFEGPILRLKSHFTYEPAAPAAVSRVSSGVSS